MKLANHKKLPKNSSLQESQNKKKIIEIELDTATEEKIAEAYERCLIDNPSGCGAVFLEKEGWFVGGNKLRSKNLNENFFKN